MIIKSSLGGSNPKLASNLNVFEEFRIFRTFSSLGDIPVGSKGLEPLTSFTSRTRSTN